jgi:hypothetical protein
MKKILFIVQLLSCLYNISFAQNNETYILTDSGITAGVNIQITDELSLGKICEVKYTTHTEKFYPINIKGFKMADGREYVSAEIWENNCYKYVFLEKMPILNDTIFYLFNETGNHFYYANNGKYKELSKNQEDTATVYYKEYFKEMFNECNFTSDYINCMRLKKTHIIKASNYIKRCKKYQFPKKYFGIYVGINKTTIDLNKITYTNIYKDNEKNDLIFGVKYRIPINLSFFYFGTDFFIEKNSFYFKYLYTYWFLQYYHIYFNYYSLNIPISLSYEANILKDKIFLKFGTNIKYNFLIDYHNYNYKLYLDDVYTSYSQSNNYIDKFYFEKLFGIGFRKSIYKHNISIEFNYFSDLYAQKIKTKTFQFNLSFEF